MTQDLASAVATLHREAAVLYAGIAREFELTSQQTQILCALSQRPSLGELATILGCDKTNVTGMVDRLEKRGLLAREPDEKDRRVSRVVLTEAGEELRERIRTRFAECVAERFGALSVEERAFCRRLAAAVSSAGSR
ncbi:DNA-binding MarR family transcriptional regulator [Amycolatopsis endophytica]|uniref:DNA-binding MarR family transcriptional regulator n=1 Tax=Amycolatopsis endophytica TaxID=860233 RepID=A0A853AVT8_9PSEU|nr:MarR family transcriptional regulator [Amycolatopsis endophytica]NYI86756.1 DNA-binding MarR family transcriptional regulator [Amycolatopsis endophytica]